MKRYLRPVPIGLFVAWAVQGLAAVHYVDLHSLAPTPPFLGWNTAATNIQDAVDSATAGDLVLVEMGCYRWGGRRVDAGPLNRLAVTNALTVKSVYGPKFTKIEGDPTPGAEVRCVYAADGAVLAGFTLTNGATGNQPGGGVWCNSTNAFLSDCVLIGNRNGGAFSGTVSNCVLIGNNGHGAQESSLQRCFISANTGDGARQSYLNNCVITLNSGSAGVEFGVAINCTIVSNAWYGSHFTKLTNCVDYYNRAGQSDWVGDHSCSPFAGPYSALCSFTNPPEFVDLMHGDLHLAPNSPCINSGANRYVSNDVDLDGSPRIRAGTVDVGAYEFQSPVSSISYAWLQGFGLAIHDTVDAADADDDGMNNWQEWICGTDPTNPLSALRLLSPTGDVPLTLTWQSVLGRRYFLERALDLTSPACFEVVATNIAGQLGTTSYTDTNFIGNTSCFYRVGVH